MKPNLPLQARMLRLYQRFQQSNLTRAAFGREEGITAAQFTYWCQFSKGLRKMYSYGHLRSIYDRKTGI
jgi:hypothetical protein